MVTKGLFFALLGAAIGAGFAGSGSGIGVGIAGSGAAGVLSEDTNKFGQTLLLQALPGTQGIYGLLFAFLVMIRVDLFGTPAQLDVSTGLAIMATGIPVGVGGLFTGIGQGCACSGAMGIIARRPEDLAKAMIYPAMVETYAVLSLLVSILMLYRIQF